MKRRGFLGLFGAAIATPFLPGSAVARAAKVAPYSAAALHGAVIHAQSRAVFSVWGLARALNLPVETTEVLMRDLAKRGVLGPLQGTTHGGRWASSRIMTREAVALQRAVKAQNGATRAHVSNAHAQPDLTAMMTHLRGIAVNYFAAKGAVA